MTNEQAAWLRTNPDYEIVGAGGMGHGGEMLPDVRHHSHLGALGPDGILRKEKAVAPALLVGKRKAPERGPGPAGLVKL
jgi:hypothetical protein